MAEIPHYLEEHQGAEADVHFTKELPLGKRLEFVKEKMEHMKAFQKKYLDGRVSTDDNKEFMQLLREDEKLRREYTDLVNQTKGKTGKLKKEIPSNRTSSYNQFFRDTE